MRFFIRAVALALCCAMLLLGCVPKKEAASVDGVEFIMDTFVQQRWYGENAQSAYDEITARFKELEGKISVYDQDSELSLLNRSAGKEAVELSEEVYDLLKRSVALCSETDGSFDITIAPLSFLWNVTGESPTVPKESDIKALLPLVDYREISFNDESKAVMLKKEGMGVDLGGIAKGYAASLAREIAERHSVSGFVSVGGNMMVIGKKPDGEDFIVGLRDPRGSETQYIMSFPMPNLTMATTGDYERYFEKDGVRYHHVLAPDTGYPSNAGLISVTVLSEDGALTDFLSTAIFLQGRERLEEYLLREDILVIAVTDELEVFASPTVWKNAKITDEKGAYSFKK